MHQPWVLGDTLRTLTGRDVERSTVLSPPHDLAIDAFVCPGGLDALDAFCGKVWRGSVSLKQVLPFRRVAKGVQCAACLVMIRCQTKTHSQSNHEAATFLRSAREKGKSRAQRWSLGVTDPTTYCTVAWDSTAQAPMVDHDGILSARHAKC